YWVGQLSAASRSRAEVVELFLISPEFGQTVSPVVRLYFAYFLRLPDYAGLIYWCDRYRLGTSLEEISGFFASSPEFQATYGSLGNGEFLTLVYQNVLGRDPDPGGFAYWMSELESGSRSRGQLMLDFSESMEYRQLTANPVYVTMTYVGLLRRAPDPVGFLYWVGVMDQGQSGLGLIGVFLESAEYKARFPSDGDPGNGSIGMPSGITVPMIDPDGVYVISWGASATAGAAYLLDEATDAAFTTGRRTLSMETARSAGITGRENGKTYYYRVKAVKPGYNDSAWQTGANGCMVKAATSWQKVVLAAAPAPANVKVRNGDVFWSDASSQPLKKTPVSGGVPTPLAGDYGLPSGLTVSGGFVYWNDGHIRRTLLDGSLTETLSEAVAVDFDYPDLIADDSHVYYLSSTASPPVYAVMQIPLSGGGATPLATSEWFPIVAIAEDSENVYWLQNRFPDPDGSSSIRKISKSGGTVEILATGLRAFKGGLVRHGNNLYFTDTNYFDTYRIMRVSTAGGAVATLVTVQPSNNDQVRGLAVDDSGIYWLDTAGVWAAPLGGGAPTLLAAAGETVTGIALTAEMVVWAEGTPVGQNAGGRIRSVPKVGGEASAIVTLRHVPQRLVVAGDVLYWTEGGYYGAIEGYGRIAKSSTAGGDASTLVMGIQTASPPFALDDRNLYVVDKWTIKKVPIDGTGIEELASGSDNIAAIDTDGVNVYWADQFANVFKIPVGGGETTTLTTQFTGGPAGPLRVHEGYIYWMDHYDAIKRMTVNGGNQLSLAPTVLPFLADFVVDATSVYFSEWDTGWLEKMPNSGGSVTPLGFAEYGQQTLLAVDNGNLFWTDPYKIGTLPVSGGATSIVYWNMTVGESRTSLTSDQTNLYWTDIGTSEIVKLSPE
ncbi:MAG: DUF4214 domain-containing protein, partial [Desulfuromonadales bacterium]|nr:DUF4214 domain-containing protein [Desulfuromonadales bacterium]